MSKQKRRVKPSGDRKLIRGYRGSTKHAPAFDKPLATLADAGLNQLIDNARLSSRKAIINE